LAGGPPVAQISGLSDASAETDPYSYHPELRDEIADPLQSFFRTFTTAALAAKAEKLGLQTGWWYSEEDREAMRTRTLAGRKDSDLWVFGYGSLMWDPAFRFVEVRRARVPDYARCFILKDIFGARGTLAAPGLMAALDKGPGCDGLAFRVARDQVDEETEVLWRREQLGPAYTATFVETHIADRAVSALAFLADHDARLIDASLTRQEQVRFLATGTGFLGSSLDYLRNIAKKFGALGVHDEEVAALLREAEDYVDSI